MEFLFLKTSLFCKKEKLILVVMEDGLRDIKNQGLLQPITS